MMEVHWIYENAIMKVIILYRSSTLILKQSLLLGGGTLYIYLLSLLTKICPHDFLAKKTNYVVCILSICN